MFEFASLLERNCLFCERNCLSPWTAPLINAEGVIFSSLELKRGALRFEAPESKPEGLRRRKRGRWGNFREARNCYW
jgi:hypothetical protein